MNCHSGIMAGTLIKSQRALLITWEWLGDHAKVEDKLVSILNYRCSSRMIERIVEQVYFNNKMALFSQLAYAKSRKRSPFRFQYRTIETSEEVREKLGLPAQVPISDDMMYGDNPWLWARPVYNLEAYVDENGHEILRWKDRQYTVWDLDNQGFNWKEGLLVR